MTQTPLTTCSHPFKNGQLEATCGRLTGHELYDADDPEHAPFFTRADAAELDRRSAEAKKGEDATAPITIEISIELDLDPDEVWPDGDIPIGWTAKDVMKLIKDTGSLSRFVQDWDMLDMGGDVTVHARGSYERGTLR